MSLEDGTEALMSGHTKGQEEKAQTALLKRVEADAKQHGTQPLSRNKICKSYGLSPSMVSKRMTGKVKSMGPGLGGARR